MKLVAKSYQVLQQYFVKNMSTCLQTLGNCLLSGSETVKSVTQNRDRSSSK